MYIERLHKMPQQADSHVRNQTCCHNIDVTKRGNEHFPIRRIDADRHLVPETFEGGSRVPLSLSVSAQSYLKQHKSQSDIHALRKGSL